MSFIYQSLIFKTEKLKAINNSSPQTASSPQPTNPYVLLQALNLNLRFGLYSVKNVKRKNRNENNQGLFY